MFPIQLGFWVTLIRRDQSSAESADHRVEKISWYYKENQSKPLLKSTSSSLLTTCCSHTNTHTVNMRNYPLMKIKVASYLLLSNTVFFCQQWAHPPPFPVLQTKKGKEKASCPGFLGRVDSTEQHRVSQDTNTFEIQLRRVSTAQLRWRLMIPLILG